MEPATPDRNSATNAPVATASDGIAPGAPWPGAFAAIGMAFRQIKKNPQPMLIILAVYVILAVLGFVISGGNQVSHDSSSLHTSSNANFTIVGLFVFLLAQPIYALALADRKKISVAEFMKLDSGAYLKIFGGGIIAGLMLILGVIPLLIGLIWVVPWVAFYTFVILDKGVGPGKSISESKALGQHNKGKVWGIIGASFVLEIASSILFFIPAVGLIAGAFISPLFSMLTYGALAILYRWIQQSQGQVPGDDPVAAGMSGAPQPPIAPLPPQPPVAPTTPVM